MSGRLTSTRACAGDATLRQEVESLLAAHDATGQFLDRPLVDLNGSAARSDAAWAAEPLRDGAMPAPIRTGSVATGSSARSGGAGWASCISPTTSSPTAP